MAGRGRIDDLTGKKFNRLTVLSRVRKENDKRTYWLCRCDCGKETVVRQDQLKSGKTKSCRCLNDELATKLGKSNFVDLTGRRFGRLFVVENVGKDKFEKHRWLCVCDCGNTKIVTGNCLCSGMTSSCGCIRIENTIKAKTTHGLSKTRLYNIWGEIVQRCTNAKCKQYKNYGGRGIKMCDEWRWNFESFYEWSINNGYHNDLTIDRINNDGNYEPDNCRWTTIIVQANNKRNNHYVEYKGRRYTVKELDRLLCGGAGFIARRLYKGWTMEEALTIPKGGYRK